MNNFEGARRLLVSCTAVSIYDECKIIEEFVSRIFYPGFCFINIHNKLIYEYTVYLIR